MAYCVDSVFLKILRKYIFFENCKKKSNIFLEKITIYFCAVN